jgi:hypothetical protein
LRIGSLTILKKELHFSVHTKASQFFGMIEGVGGVAELVPAIVIAFPSVSLLLTGDKKLEIVGTFDRMHYAPFRFAGAVVPDCCLEHIELVGHAKRVGGLLLNKVILGYVMIDFMLYRDDGGLKLMGYDIRLNAFPSFLMSTYMTLCAGFNAESGRVVLLRHVGEGTARPIRHVVVQNAVTHAGLGLVSMKDIRKTCYAEGIFFDLLNRTGFRMVFFDMPTKGKNFVLQAAANPEAALLHAERSYTFLLKLFAQKAGTDGISTLANGLLAIRKFRERVFVEQKIPVPLPL